MEYPPMGAFSPSMPGMRMPMAMQPRAANGTHYEFGLDVSDEAPHIISRAVQLVGRDGRLLSQPPEDGDELLAVNVCPSCANASH